MDSKMMLCLMISALCAVTSAYPSDGRAHMQQEMTCNPSHTNTIYVFESRYRVQRCTLNGTQCFQGLPRASCNGLAEYCNFYTFGKDENFLWTTYICQKPWERGYCYEPGNRPRCEDVTAVQAIRSGGVRICNTDVNGVKQCSDLPEASAMDWSDDCFCVEDPRGNRVCQPPHCGDSLPKRNEWTTRGLN